MDNLKWKVGKNRASPRTQLAVKQTELFKTLQTLISQGIVEKSQSPHYSQILMVPKPDGIFRMCVDYLQLRLKGGILAGSLESSSLKVSENSVQSVRNRDCRSSSPEK